MEGLVYVAETLMMNLTDFKKVCTYFLQYCLHASIVKGSFSLLNYSCWPNL